MSDFVMVSDQDGFNPEVAVPSIAQYGLMPRNEVYLFDNGRVDSINLAEALMLKNVGPCPDVFLMFMYDAGIEDAEQSNALYKEMCRTLKSSDRSHQDAKMAIYRAQAKRVIAAGAAQWKARRAVEAMDQSSAV